MSSLPSNIPGFLQTDAWKNQNITLYHGTITPHANSILKSVDLSECKTGSDFGKGFYTTTVLDQAKSWAWSTLERSKQMQKFQHYIASSLEAVVVEFDVPRDKLVENMTILAFVLGNRDSADFWSLVWHCRSGGVDHKVTFSHTGNIENMYDLVVGPVAGQWRLRQTIDNTDQLSLHTTAAVDVLNSLIPHKDKKICWRHK